MSNPSYEMSVDEARIVAWLEQGAKLELSEAAPREPSSAHFQHVMGSGLKEIVAAQIRLGMHRQS